MNKKKVLLGFIALSTATFACSIFVGGPAYPTVPNTISTSAVPDLQTSVQQAVADGTQSGIVTLKLTESQLTSFLTSKLESQADPLITEPQVLLRDGQMMVYGKVQSGIFTANVNITTQVSVDENGQPKIEITHTDFGPVPVPNGLNEAVSSFVSEAFTGSLGPIATGFRLESISITDGIMTITGRVK